MKFHSCRINIEFLLHGEVRKKGNLSNFDSRRISLCHINNIHRLFSLSCCLLWFVKQPQHLNIKLFNQHVIRKSTGGSRLTYCKLSCWHYMLIPKCLTANIAFLCLSVSVSCHFPVVFYSFLHTVRCKQLGEEAFKNIPLREPGCVFLIASLSVYTVCL